MSLHRTIFRIAQFPSFDLISPLSRNECIRRIGDNIEPFSWKIGFVNASPRPFTGRVGESDFQLANRLDGGDGNLLQLRLFGEFADDQDKTRLHCYVGVPPFVVALVVFWFLGAIILGVGFVLQGDDAVTPLWFLAIGVALVVRGHYLARDKFLINLVQDILEARKV